MGFGTSKKMIKRSLRQRITEQEIKIMLGALSLSETPAEAVMRRRIEDVVSVSEDAVVDLACCERLFTTGYSRIPVHRAGDPRMITGYLITKTLITLIYRTEDRAPSVKELVIKEPLRCGPQDMLSEVYLAMQEGSCHIAVVEEAEEDEDVGRYAFVEPRAPRRALGIISSHDILEHIHKTRFADETDASQANPVQKIVRNWNQLQWKKAYMSAVGSQGGGNGVWPLAATQGASAPSSIVCIPPRDRNLSIGNVLSSFNNNSSLSYHRVPSSFGVVPRPRVQTTAYGSTVTPTPEKSTRASRQDESSPKPRDSQRRSSGGQSKTQPAFRGQASQ
jgi:CBS domain-containing protein